MSRVYEELWQQRWFLWKLKNFNRHTCVLYPTKALCFCFGKPYDPLLQLVLWESQVELNLWDLNTSNPNKHHSWGLPPSSTSPAFCSISHLSGVPPEQHCPVIPGRRLCGSAEALRTFISQTGISADVQPVQSWFFSCVIWNCKLSAKPLKCWAIFKRIKKKYNLRLCSSYGTKSGSYFYFFN